MSRRKKVEEKENDIYYESMEIDDIASQLFKHGRIEHFDQMMSQLKYGPIATEILRRNRLILVKSGGTNFGKCPKCGAEDNVLIALQTRSSDEPIDFFIVCNKCQNKWHAS